MKTVFVTGATGFVGHRLTEILRAGGLKVVRLVRAGAPAGPDDLVGDLASGLIPALPPGLDAIIHLAQSRAYRAFPADVPQMFAVNVAGTLSLLQAAADAGVGRFCLVSSGSVYEPFEGPLSETAALAPRSFLGASKAAAELVAGPFAALMTLSVLRLFSPYGPGQTERLIPDLVARVREGRTVTLAGGDGGMTFSPTFVDDVCEVIRKALSEGWSGTFNVASPEVLDLRRAVTIIARQLGREPVFSSVEGKPLSLVPDLARLSGRMDISAFVPFERGIAACLEAAPRHD